MKLWHLYFRVNKDIFPDGKVYKKLDKNKRSKWTTSFSFDIDFLTDYVSRYLELKIRKLKFEGSYSSLYIEFSNEYKIIKGSEAVSIQVPFDIKKFKELYPSPNLIPLQYNELINPILDEDLFNNFLFDIVIDAFNFAQAEKLEIPTNYLIEEVNNFKLNNFKREWYHQKKAFKDYGISTRLFCTETSSRFTLELIILKKRKEIFRKEIGQANPNYIMYRLLLGQVETWDNTLAVVKKYQDYLPNDQKQCIVKLKLDEIL